MVHDPNQRPNPSSEELKKESKKHEHFKLLFITVLLFACMDKPKTDRNEQLAGMYKLYSIEVQDTAGIYHHEWASDGTGYIIYDGKGHMAVQIIPKEI